MIYDRAFTNYILNQKVIDWQFQHDIRMPLPNSYLALSNGLFNGYKIIARGATLHKTDIQEAMMLDLEGVPFLRISKI